MRIITFDTEEDALEARHELYNMGMYSSDLTIQFYNGRGYDLIITNEDETRPDWDGNPEINY